MEILSLPVHYAIQHISKIKNFAAIIARSAMMAVWLLRQQSLIAHIWIRHNVLRNYIVFERGVFLMTRQADDQGTLMTSFDMYIKLNK